MNDETVKKKLYHQIPLRILSFLSSRPGIIFSANEVSAAVKCSKGATNQALRLFLDLGVLSREQKGNLFLYKLNADNFLLRHFKIFENLIGLEGVVKEIRKYCYEIVLFGSCADGSNSSKSDIDLFISTEYKKEVRKVINRYEAGAARCQAVIQDPLESISLKKENSVFYGQVKKGITLWKGKPAHEEI